MKLDWKTLVSVLGPAILANVPHADKLAPLVPTIVHGIGEAEGLKGASGEEKKAHVLALVADAVTGINSAKGHTVVSPDGLATVAGSGIDTVIGAINLVHAAHVPVGVLLPPSALGVHAGSTGE
jgi:hypothetical protein